MSHQRQFALVVVVELDFLFRIYRMALPLFIFEAMTHEILKISWKMEAHSEVGSAHLLYDVMILNKFILFHITFIY